MVAGRAASGRATFVALAYSVVAAAPLFLVTAQAVRLQHELDFGPARLGALVSICFAASALAAAPMGTVVERTGGAVGLRLSAALSLAALLCMATIATRWWYVAVAMALCGAANAIAQVSANVVLAGDVPGGRQGLAFGVKQSAVPLASLAAGLAVPPLALLASWRASFAAAAVTAAAMLATRWGLPRSRRGPSRDGSPDAPPRATRDGPPDALRDGSPEAPRRASPQARGPRRAVLWLTAATGLLAGGGGTALPAFAVDAAVSHGIHEAAAGLLLAAGSLAAIVARVGTGWIADLRRSAGFTELMALVAAGAVSMLALAASGGSTPLLILGLLAAFASAWGWPGVIYYATVRGYPSAPGAATGFVLSVVYVGNVIGPTGIGLIAQHGSYAAAWTAGAIVMALATLTALAARAVERRLDSSAAKPGPLEGRPPV